MRNLFYSILFMGLLSALTCDGETGRSVHLRPSINSPTLGTLPEGGFFTAPPDSVELSEQEERAGWKAISFLDDFRGFVRRTDMTKDLRVTPGSAVYSSAVQDSSMLLTRAHANDLFEVERLAGDWVEVSFRKSLTGFVRSENGVSSPASGARDAARNDVAVLEEIRSTPQRQPSQGSVVSDRAGIPTDGILRAFEGRLGQPRSFFGRPPPHAYQIIDSSGNRIAYLDLSKLLITTPLEHFLGREFHFYGRAEPVEGRRDFVIRVEQMRQR